MLEIHITRDDEDDDHVEDDDLIIKTIINHTIKSTSDLHLHHHRVI